MSLENTKQWAKDKDGLSAYVAIFLGMSPYAIQNFCTQLIEREVHTVLSKSDIDAWTKLYKKHRLLCKALYQYLQREDDNWILLQSKPIRLFSRIFLTGTLKQRQRLLRAMGTVTEEKGREYVKELNAAISSWLEDLAQDKPTKNITHESLPLEPVFLLKIYAFCWLEYGEHFTTIYRKARQGDFEAIEKLLRIDPLILHDKFIREHYTTAPEAISHLLQTAYNNPRKSILKVSQIKSSLCGFISAFFEHVGQQAVTPMQIRELFDSLARDLERKSIDEDLPDEYDAFRKAVKRYHKFWLPIITATLPRHS